MDENLNNEEYDEYEGTTLRYITPEDLKMIDERDFQKEKLAERTDIQFDRSFIWIDDDNGEIIAYIVAGTRSVADAYPVPNNKSIKSRTFYNHSFEILGMYINPEYELDPVDEIYLSNWGKNRYFNEDWWHALDGSSWEECFLKFGCTDYNCEEDFYYILCG